MGVNADGIERAWHYRRGAWLDGIGGPLDGVSDSGRWRGRGWMQPSGPEEGVAGWGRHSQLGQVPQKGLWRDGFDSARVRVHELGRLDREGWLSCNVLQPIGSGGCVGGLLSLCQMNR